MSRKAEQVISLFINIFTFGFWWLMEVLDHHMEVELNTKCIYLKRASYGEFKREFRKRKWVARRPHMDTLFCEDPADGLLCDDMFRFGDVGYLMTAYGLIRARRLIRREVRKQIMKQ